jgi:hypothetical protein
VEGKVIRGSKVNRLLLVAVVVIAAASATVSACGGGSGDRALFDKALKAFASNDVAMAKVAYAADAVIQWPEGSDPAASTGIDAISKMAAGYPVDPVRVGDATFSYVPSAKDIELLTSAYKGARYVAAPVTVGRDLYMVVMEIRAGEVANEWISYMYRQTP